MGLRSLLLVGNKDQLTTSYSSIRDSARAGAPGSRCRSWPGRDAPDAPAALLQRGPQVCWAPPEDGHWRMRPIEVMETQRTCSRRGFSVWLRRWSRARPPPRGRVSACARVRGRIGPGEGAGGVWLRTRLRTDGRTDRRPRPLTHAALPPPAAAPARQRRRRCLRAHAGSQTHTHAHAHPGHAAHTRTRTRARARTRTRARARARTHSLTHTHTRAQAPQPPPPPPEAALGPDPGRAGEGEDLGEKLLPPEPDRTETPLLLLPPPAQGLPETRPGIDLVGRRGPLSLQTPVRTGSF
uniref:uncharacterized protein LOC129512153 n=1 Tax=Nyctereutes procyonoides TaxID=34880 RepID=UPI00244485BE|nr:uncharacterized protein LOC129512153 [Nyctereutes procyonoides]